MKIRNSTGDLLEKCCARQALLCRVRGGLILGCEQLIVTVTVQHVMRDELGMFSGPDLPVAFGGNFGYTWQLQVVHCRGRSEQACS